MVKRTGKKASPKRLSLNRAFLKYIVYDRGDTMGGLADAMGVVRPTMTRKFEGSANFSLTELQFIVERYHMTDVEILKAFFTEQAEAKTEA